MKTVYQLNKIIHQKENLNLILVRLSIKFLLLRRRPAKQSQSVLKMLF